VPAAVMALSNDLRRRRPFSRDHRGRYTRPFLAMTARRFPPAWSIENIGACYLVKDVACQKWAAVYYEEEPRRRSAKLLERDNHSRFRGTLSKMCAGNSARSLANIADPELSSLLGFV
jgi:hypothetical protein